MCWCAAKKLFTHAKLSKWSLKLRTFLTFFQSPKSVTFNVFWVVGHVFWSTRYECVIAMTVCVACDAVHLFECPGTGRCISASYVCNGVDECGNGADEQRCGKWCLNPFNTTLMIMIHTHPFNGPLSGWAGTGKVKPIWILLKQETVSGSGISWATCKFPPRFRQITTPTPHHSVFTGRMPPNQQCQSTEGIISIYLIQHQW